VGVPKDNLLGGRATRIRFLHENLKKKQNTDGRTATEHNMHTRNHPSSWRLRERQLQNQYPLVQYLSLTGTPHTSVAATVDCKYCLENFQTSTWSRGCRAEAARLLAVHFHRSFSPFFPLFRQKMHLPALFFVISEGQSTYRSRAVSQL